MHSPIDDAVCYHTMKRITHSDWTAVLGCCWPPNHASEGGLSRHGCHWPQVTETTEKWGLLTREIDVSNLPSCLHAMLKSQTEIQAQWVSSRSRRSQRTPWKMRVEPRSQSDFLSFLVPFLGTTKVSLFFTSVVLWYSGHSFYPKGKNMTTTHLELNV